MMFTVHWDMNKNSKILVTGATGLVGAQILRDLKSHDYKNLSILCRETSRLDLIEDVVDDIKICKGNLLDIPSLEEAMIDCDLVIHCAAMVSMRKKDHDQMRRINVEGTANVVNMALYCEIPKIIHVSSIAALGRTKPGDEVNETHDWQDSPYNSAYAKTKYEAELEIRRGEAEGLEVAILNPSVILGVGFWNQSSLAMFPTIYKGVPFYPLGGNGVVDVRDVSKAAMELIQGAHWGQRFIISGHNVMMKDLVTKIALALQVKPPSKALKGWLKWISWRAEAVRAFFSGKSPLITKQTVETTSRVWKFDSTKSRESLNLTYRPLDHTINDVAKSYLDSIRQDWDYGRWK